MNIKNIFSFFKKTNSRPLSGGPLREFIYLDEVSVHSLLASTRGPIAFEYLDTLSNTRQSELEGEISLNSGLIGTQTRARRFDTQSNGTQVTRKSIIQALFKQLYDQEKESLVIYPVRTTKNPSDGVMSFDSMKKDLLKLEADGLVIDPAKLKRGQLLEIEVQLEADMVFRISTVISVFREILEENLDAFGNNDFLDISSIKSIDKVLEKILVGLIPIRGLSVDYRILTIDNKEWVVHQKCLAQLNDNVPSMPLYVVGVTEQKLFWKDIRRLLFAKSRYNALCRLSLDGITNTWSPMKIVNLIDSVVPGLTEEMHLSQPDKLAKMIQPNKAEAKIDFDEAYQVDQSQMKRALQIYSDLVASEYNITLTELNHEHLESLSEENSLLFSTVDVRRPAFNIVLNYLSEHYTFKPDLEVTSAMRNEAIRKAKIENLPKESSFQNFPISSIEEERFLDTEFIAIYW